jgi:DHA1 family bicyclomycin/chloramphenicol resistance-like MFS transporter
VPLNGGADAPMPSKLLRNALILGLLTAVGPFAIDMYLPALPSVARSLGASTGAVQMSLMAFLVTMGLGQLVYGPVADILGRKPPLYFGLVLFVVASVGCSLAPDIRTLVAFRFLQGLGASAGMVVPIAIVRDLHTGAEAARLMSLLMLVFSVSPILSPVIGTFVVEAWGWRAIFAIVTCAAGMGVVLLATLLPETRPAAMRQESEGLRGVVAGYRTLIADRNFTSLALIVAFGIASFFAFLANSSFLLIQHFGLTPRQYSLAFSLNAASFIGASQLTGWLGRRIGLQRVVRIGVSGFAVTMTTLFVVTLTGVDRLGALLPPLFVGYGFLGLVIPTTTVLALEDHGTIAGTASALIATLESLIGVAVIAVVGLFLDGTARPMMGGIAGCAVATFALAQHALGSSVAGEPAV